MSRSKRSRARPKPVARERIPDEMFVEIWQKSVSLGNVAELLRVTPREVSLYAYKLRRAGVPLKRFSRAGLDVEALTKIAERHTPRKR